LVPISRIAVGPWAGKKLFTLQTMPGRPPELEDDANGAARAGFSGRATRWSGLRVARIGGRGPPV